VLPRNSRPFFAFLLAFVSIAGGRQLLGQAFDFESDRINIEELHGYWRFHTDDDPNWANPGFDDSKWLLLRSDQSWNDQGYKGYSGIAWYRFKLILPAAHPQLALYIPELATSYQVFANGRFIGQFGGLPPHGKDITGGLFGAGLRSGG
jgi:phosphoserine phosphatase RsbU/P